MTELSAGDFADKVSSFFKLPRVTLQELLAAPPLVKPFSQRFLRATSVFPHEAAGGRPALAVADPSDLAAVRAAEIVLGGEIAVRVASFEDIATVLDHRLGDEEAGPPAQERPVAPREDDVENLRDLASGAPVVRALNDLFEKAVELRASDIHVEPFRTGLVVRLRVDGLLRAVPAPAGILPQALISRIKILAGLNIGERRLPQDGAARLRIARTDLDVRVAIMPTQHGEAAVIRLLPTDRGTLAVEKLGLSAADEATLQATAAASPRHDRRHRADGKRQDDHACHHACGTQPADPQDSYH